MSFQSRKITADTVLHFPGRAATVVPSTADSLLPVLIVLHQETSTPGRVGNVLRALGYRLDIRRPRFGDPLPDTLEQHAGAVIFGGPMSANDPDDYVYHWHREGFELPTGCALLAEGDDFPVQAVRYGDAYGLQFHPDVTYAML